MNVTLTITSHFDAAHRMPAHPLSSRHRLHGHTYTVAVTMPNNDGSIDLEHERVALRLLLERYDHRQLAESTADSIPGEDALVLGAPVTMEAIACDIARRIPHAVRVRVSSQPDAYAEVEQ